MLLISKSSFPELHSTPPTMDVSAPFLIRKQNHIPANAEAVFV